MDGQCWAKRTYKKQLREGPGILRLKPVDLELGPLVPTDSSLARPQRCLASASRCASVANGSLLFTL